MPLVASSVGTMKTTVRGKYHKTNSYLNKSIITQLRAGQGWRCAKETRVCYFLHSLSDGQNEGSVDERHDDISIVFVCK